MSLLCGRHLLVLFLVLAVVAGCDTVGLPEEPEEPHGDPEHPVAGELVCALVGEPDTFNSILATDAVSEWACTRVYASLVRIDENLRPVGEVASSWDISGDGLEYTFHLSEDVFFHDGEQLTAEDVAFTFNAVRDPDYPGPLAERFEVLNRVDIMDELTVRFVISQPYAPFLSRLTTGILPAHLYADDSLQDIPDNPYSMDPIGAGPYRFKEWVPGRHIILEANEAYFAEGPYIARQVLRLVKDSDTALAALLDGEIDCLSLSSRDAASVMDICGGRFSFHHYESLSYTYLGLNHEVQGLDDCRVRRAISFGIDEQAIIAEILDGHGHPMYSPIPRVSWAYNDAIKTYEYSPDRAAALLEDAGYTRGSDGVLEKAGTRLSFTLMTNAGNTQREAITLMIRDSMAEIGIEISPEFVEWDILLDRHLSVGDFEMVVSGLRTGLDPDGYGMFHSSRAERCAEAGRFVGFNRFSFRDDRIDELLEEGLRETDMQMRAGIYAEFQERLAELQPVIWLFRPQRTAVVAADIHGVITSPEGPVWSWLWYVE